MYSQPQDERVRFFLLVNGDHFLISCYYFRQLFVMMITSCNRLSHQILRPKVHWIFFCVIVSVVFIFYGQVNLVLFNQTRLIDDDVNTSSLKTILIWNGLPGNMGQLLGGSGRSPFLRLECQVNQCFIEEKRKRTNKRSNHHKLSLKHYDAVLFNMNMIKSRYFPPFKIASMILIHRLFKY